MAKCMVVLAVCVLSAHAAQFYSKDTHNRIPRSPFYYGPDGPPPPPPPPPGPPPPPPPGPPPVLFRTKNWSGLARGADGSAQGVFSGAAAAAESLPTSGSAYSLASSGVTGPGCEESGQADIRGQSSGNSGSYGGQSSQYNRQGSYGGSSLSQTHGSYSDGQQSRKSQGNQGNNGASSGYSRAQSSALAGNAGDSAGNHDVESFGDQKQLQQTGFSGGQQQVQLDSHFNDHGKHQVGFSSQAGAGAYTGAAQSKQSNYGTSNSQGYGGSNSGGFSSSSSQAGTFGASESRQNGGGYIRGDIGEDKGQFNKSPQLGSSYNAGSSQIREPGNYGSGYGGQISTGGGFSESQQTGSNTGALNSGYSESSKGNVGAEDLQTTLGGALKLASQGLQASEQSGCSTCGKSNYALSNAKSHSGSAVALSIGG